MPGKGQVLGWEGIAIGKVSLKTWEFYGSRRITHESSLFDSFKCPNRPLTLLPLYLVRHRRKPPKLRYLPPSDNAGTGSSRGSYAIIKGDISTLYKDMSYLKSCKLTSPSIFVLLLLSPLSPSLPLSLLGPLTLPPLV